MPPRKPRRYKWAVNEPVVSLHEIRNPEDDDHARSGRVEVIIPAGHTGRVTYASYGSISVAWDGPVAVTSEHALRWNGTTLAVGPQPPPAPVSVEDSVRSFYVELTISRTLARAALADEGEGDDEWGDNNLGEVIQEGLGSRIDRQIGQQGADDNRVSVGVELTDSDGSVHPSWTATYNGSNAPLDVADQAAVEYAFNDLVATYRSREGVAGVR